MIRIYINGASGKMGQSLLKLIESDDQFQSVSENDFSLTSCCCCSDFTEGSSTSCNSFMLRSCSCSSVSACESVELYCSLLALACTTKWMFCFVAIALNWQPNGG